MATGKKKRWTRKDDVLLRGLCERRATINEVKHTLPHHSIFDVLSRTKELIIESAKEGKVVRGFRYVDRGSVHEVWNLLEEKEDATGRKYWGVVSGQNPLLRERFLATIQG